MIHSPKVGAVVLLLLFLSCMPLHITHTIGMQVHEDLHASSGTDATTALFSHFKEMTTVSFAPLELQLLTLLVLLAFCIGRSLEIYTCTYRKFLDDGWFRGRYRYLLWLRRHNTSPPYTAM